MSKLQNAIVGGVRTAMGYVPSNWLPGGTPDPLIDRRVTLGTQQSRVDGRRGRRHGDADGDQARAATGHGVDDADAAAGQAGVDSEDAHAWRQSSFSSSAMTSSEASKFA